MRIVIVCAFFPPQRSIASLRPYTWAKYWSRLGHDVTVITTKKNTPYEAGGDDQFKVIEFAVPFVGGNKEQNTNIGNSQILSKKNKKTFVQIIKTMVKKFAEKTGCFYSCRFPDFHDVWIRRIEKSEYIMNCKKIDLLVSTGWPYSVHRLGLFLKKEKKLNKWIVDWRDPWTKNQMFNGFFLFRPYERFLEKEIHKNATVITTVCDPITEMYSNMTKTPVFTIPNGFDREDYDGISFSKSEKIRIVYTGSVYKQYQTPETLFEAIGNLKRKGVVSDKNLEVIFAGNNADVSDLAKRYDIEDCYIYLGIVEHRKAIELQKSADILLFLEYYNPDFPGVVTGKIYEYLYIAKEIWAVGLSGPKSGGDLILEAKAGERFFNDVERLEQTLKNVILGNRIIGADKDLSLINQYDRETLALKMLGLIYET